MVGIFTGLGSGLERGSVKQLGAAGLLGSAAFGRSGEQLYLNAAAGSLLIGRDDEFLVGRGPDASIARTYNSLGNATDENGDNWRQSTDRRIFGETGTRGTAGATVTRRSADGSEIVYTSDASGIYTGTDGEGGYDTLTYASGTGYWTWTDGDTHTVETYEVTYASAAQWRLKQVADKSGIAMALSYVSASDHLDKVTTSDGGYIQYSWSGNNITQVVTHYTDLPTGVAKTLTRVRYAYDGSNRLTSVTTDLSPEDNSVTDGKVYTATYTYDGTSTRVATIVESDGTSIAVAYDTTSHKVTSITQTVASGVTRVTGVAYTSSTLTTITDPLGQVTTLEYNADGSLKKITAPPAVTGATAQTVQFTYDGSGNVLTVTDALGKVTTYGNYFKGNWQTQTDPLGNVVTRTYDTANNLTSETRIGYDRVSNAGTHTTRYVYDGSNRLIWMLTAEGDVTKYDYDAYGQLKQTTNYQQSYYDVKPLGPTTMVSDAQLVSWADAQTNKTMRIIDAIGRDTRGGIVTDTRYAAADSSGNAITTAGETIDSFIYDQAGRLLTRYRNSENHEQFVYDGLGRMTASTDVNGGVTSFVFTDSNIDNSTKTKVTTAAGYIQTYTYNRAGDLISSINDAGAGVLAGTTAYQYDALGRVRVATDANTNKTYTLYDHAGRKTADIDSFGNVIEYRYDADNRVVATIRWNTPISGTNLTALANPANTLEIATIRPASDAADLWRWSVYDADGRMAETIEGDGSATAYEYDASSRLVRTTVYSNKLTSTQIGTIKTTPPATALLPTASSGDSYTRTFYDMDGRLNATLDGNGYFTVYSTWTDGLKGVDKHYIGLTDPALRANGTFQQIGISAGSTVDRTFYVFDEAQRLRYQIDNLSVTEYVYNDGVSAASDTDKPREVIRYNGTVTVGGTINLATMQSLIATAGLASDPATRTTYMVYDAAERLAYSIDGSGAVTGYGYDGAGRLIKTVQYATTRSTTSLPSLATMASWATANAGSSDRITRTYYTVRGEVGYTIDGEGYVTGKTYDAKGQLVSEKLWDTPVSATDSWTFGNVTTAVAALTSTTTAYTYDLDGRVSTTRDGAGHGHDYSYYANGLLAWDIRMSGSATDESKTKFVYDAAGRLTDRYDGWTSGSASTHYSYDGHGNQVGVTDPNGKTLTRTFDLNGQVLTETDPLGGVTTYEYDARGNVVKTTDARGNSSYNYYSLSGQLVATRDAESYVTTTTYNAFGQVASVTRHSVRATNTAAVGTLPTWTWDGTDVPVTTSYEYDKLGNVAKVTDPLSNYQQFTYNAFGETSVTRDERGMLTSEAYDKRGLLKTEIADTAGKAITTSFTYNSRGQVLTATDANGKVTTSTYDAGGRLATVKDALNNTTSYTYDGRDNLVAVTDARLNVTRSIYDANDRKIAAIDALGGVVTYAYDADGRLITQTEYKNRVSTGSMGTQVAMSTLTPLLVANADDRVTHYAYDDDGQLRFTVDAKLHVAEMEYDATGNVVRITAYDGVIAGTSFTTSGIATQVASLTGNPRTTRAVYDALGRQIWSIDALGHATWFVRDALNNIVKQVDYSVAYTAAGNPTIAAMTTWQGSTPVVADAAKDRTARAWFDADGRTIYSLDAQGYVTRTEYDAGGNVTKTTRYTEAYAASDATTAANLASFYTAPASPQVTQYTYDTAGRLIETLDGEGNKTRVTLSQAGQVLTSTSAADTTDAHVVTYTYDNVGRLATETVQIGTGPSGSDLVTSYTYDAVGNQVKVHDARGNDSYAYYDALGQRVAMRDPESNITETAYTTFGEVASVTQHSAKATNTASTTLPAWTWSGTDVPATTLFEYDKLGQLTKSTDAMGAYEQYTLGNFGERLSVRNKLGGTSSYTYDKNGQVLTETLPTTILTKNTGGTSISVINRYEYDAYGNRTKMVEADGAAEMRTTLYTYDKLDQLLTTVGDAVTVLSATLVESSYTPTQTLTYDSRGNVIKSVDADAATFFYYDRNDRLIAQISPVGTLSTFVYDHNGNKTSEKMFGTAVSLPGSPGGTPPVGTGTVRETRYAYDRANRLVSTTTPSLQTGEYTGGAWAFTTGDIVSSAEYDPTGNVTREVDGRGNSVYHWYDKAGREVARIDEENYLTVWERDAEGNATKETRYANKVTGAFTSATAATSLPGLLGTGAADANRITDFTYDKNGRRLTETRESVAYVAVDGSGTVTSGTASSLVTYTYDGLGNVLTKVEANGDTTAYTYDAIGRLASETGQTFTDYAGLAAASRTAYNYDGLDNLKSTRVQVDATGTNAADRVTTYTYGAGGRLATMTDAMSQTHIYGYDKAGRAVLDRYTRAKSDASTVTEAKVTLYDVAGRATTQTTARLNGTTWVFTSELTGNPAYDAVNMAYDAFGEMTGRGVSAAGATAAYQEFFDYDAGGRLWRSNTGDGVLRFHVYDKAGNETLTLASTGADLSMLTVSTYTASITSTGDTTTTDAVSTICVYDKRGQMTAVREPDRLLATGTTTTTIAHANSYNAFGEVLSETGAGGFTATGDADTTVNAYGHTKFEVFTTQYGYNTMGRTTSKAQAMVDVTAADGSVTHDVRPTEYYGYDLSGRLDRVTDANGNVTKRALLAGTGHGDSEALVTREFHADTGVFETKYDVFGDVRVLRNELYYYNTTTSTDNAVFSDETRSYDKLGQLLTVGHRGGALTDSYTYDILGQQLTNTETWLVSGSPVSVTAKTDYDAKGRIVRQQTFGGDVTTMVYSWSATLQALDISGTAVASAGGWVTVTTTPNTAHTTSQSEDVFGQTVSSTDMGGNVTDYRYDLGGRTARRRITVGTAKDTYNYSYYNSGSLAETRYTNGEPGAGTNYTLWIEAYSYDVSGNELTDHLDREVGTNIAYGHYENDHEPGVPPRYVIDGYNFVISTVTFENLSTTYDALSRMVTYDAAATDVTPVASIHYYYDQNSNIRRTYATYRNLDQYGIVVTTVPPAQDYWYRYDSMNRVVTAKGIQSGSTVVAGTGGTDYSYNGAGHRVTASTSFSAIANFTAYGPMGPYTASVPYTGTRVETYSYTADGQIATVRIGQTGWTGNTNGTINLTAPGMGSLRSKFTYDARSRLLEQIDYLGDGDYYPTAAYDRQLSYNSQGQVDTEIVSQLQGSDTFVTTTTNTYTNYDGYLLGAVTTAYATTTKNGSAYSTSQTINAYNWRDSVAIAGTTIYNTQVGSLATSYSTSYTYTTAGTLASAWIADGVSRGVNYCSDTLGQVIRRDEGTIAPHEVWYRFGGKQLGYVGNNGTLDTNYQTSINNRTATPTGSGLFQNGATTPTAYADFDQSLDPINSYSQGGAGGSYTARGGETLAGLASQLWGDATLWYKLAEVNGLTGSATLAAGQVIAIPGGVMRSTNSASTFQPYDAAAAMGDTSPTHPSPPAPQKAKKGCGIIGQILMIAIAVAVTALLTGPLSGAIGSLLAGGGTAAVGSAAAIGGAIIGGAIAGAVGSLASQVFGLATNTIDKFSWKGVALAAISGAVGGGLGAVAKAGQAMTALQSAGKALAATSKLGSVLRSVAQFVGQGGIAGGAIRGLLGNVIGQGIGIATHLQKRFDFVGAAAAGVGGGVSASFHVSGSPVIDNAVTGMAGGIADAATRSVLTGTDFGDSLMAALPDIIGSTVGNAIAGAVTRSIEDQNLKKALMAAGNTEASAKAQIKAWRAAEADPQKLHALLDAGNGDDPADPDISAVTYNEQDARDAARAQALAKGKSAADAEKAARQAIWYTRVRERVQFQHTRVMESNLPASVKDQYNSFYRTMAFALIDADVYNDQTITQMLLPGYRRLSDAQVSKLKLTPAQMNNPSSGYFAAIYTDPEGGYIYSNRGTDDNNPVMNTPDGVTNRKQAQGKETEQYDTAVDNALALLRNNPGIKVTFTGHSLGGGLAEAQAFVTKRPAIVFNAAGVHDKTVGRYLVTLDKSYNKYVTAYGVKGEPLTALNGSLLSGVGLVPPNRGNFTWLDPVAPLQVPELEGRYTYTHAYSPEGGPSMFWWPNIATRVVGLHSMVSVISSLYNNRNPIEHPR